MNPKTAKTIEEGKVNGPINPKIMGYPKSQALERVKVNSKAYLLKIQKNPDHPNHSWHKSP